MLKSYIKLAWRNLFKNKMFSLINISGLTIGITCTLTILLWVRNELSWDTFQKNYGQVHQVFANRNFNGEIITDGSIMLPLADALEQNFPQVKNASFTSYPEDHTLSIGEKKIKQSGLRVSKHFFNIFSWTFLKGNMGTALSNPDAIILNKSTARLFFGEEDPVNKILRLDNRFDVKVTAVVDDAPDASSIRFDFITPFNYEAAEMEDWRNSYTSLYIQTAINTDETALQKRMNEMISRRDPGEKSSTYFFHPMRKWRLYSDFKDGKNTGGMIDYVKLFTIIAVIILLIACINFMNLSTARSEKRAKEVGIRKTLGSGKKELILQYFTESIIIAILAFICSILLIWILLPVFNRIIDRQLALDVMVPQFWAAALLIILFTGLLAGSYPALYLSSFNPVKVLKGTFLPGKNAALPRKFLVVGQFTVSILLIASTIIIYRQINHVKNRDIGYLRSNLLMIPSSEEINTNYTVIKQELLASGLVSSSTRTSAPITDIWNFTPAPDYEGKPAGGNMIFSALGATEDYTKTIGIHLLEGRDFAGTPADSSSLLLNETAVRIMQLKNPLGMQMKYNNRNYTVIGITANVVMASPYKAVDPMMVLYRPNHPAYVMVRLKDKTSPQKAIAALEIIFTKHNPAYPFDYKFADQEFQKKFITEELISRLTNIFAGLAIIICCLGLSGLAAFTIQKRFKEIGIRKVLGASSKELLLMLSREFLYLVLIAFSIAIPLTWWSMSNWLETYAYRINISAWYFIIAGVSVLLLTLLTVVINGMNALLTKPAKSLRAE
jgi:putative ABC transport system permease protein